MPGHDYCAVFGCPNGRHLKEKQIKKDHVGVLRWHRPKENDRHLWEKQINRKNFKLTMSTVVCSNHFVAGYYTDTCNVPTLYMKGYSSTDDQNKRKSPMKRDNSIILKRPRKEAPIQRYGFDECPPVTEDETPAPCPEHDYVLIENDDQSCARCYPSDVCESCRSKLKTTQTLMERVQKQEEVIETLKKNQERQSFSINDIKNNDKLVNLYTGLQSYAVFQWLFNRLRDKVKNLTYTNYKQPTSGKKRGPKRILSPEDEMFLTLVRVRLGLVEEDLAYRFKISQSTVSSITSTWYSFLAKEWNVFIHWPTQEENKRYFPKCFSKWPNTVAILDCTEGGIEKPSLAKAQAQTYSTYKSKNTWKKLISITPGGIISFISKAYGGSASDRFIVENSGILQHVNPLDEIMADKGFNISDLLVGKGAKLVIPPFLKDKAQFSTTNVKTTSDIAKARIHVERAIARIKDFKILQGNVPVIMTDQLDDIFIIVAAINNIGPCLVPL